jgi:hypothetical protein
MSGRWMKIMFGAALAVTATGWLSCGQDHKLVAIEIQPAAGFNFATPDPAAQGVFTAIGTYVHPPGTADITKLVTWKTDVPQLLVINGGVVSPQPGNVCGIADVYADFNSGGNFVTNFATVTVNDRTRVECPGGSTTQAVVTVNLTPADGGVVTSVPSGITCPALVCGAQFTVGDTIALTASPNTGHTFNAWSGCTTTNGTTCSLVVPPGGAGVAVTFN